MRNKKHLVIDDLEEGTIKEDSDTEIVDVKSCKVEYDMSRLQVFAIDGVLTHLDEEEGRLIFFTNISSVGDVNKKEKELRNKCVVELRTTPSCMKRIFSIISGEIDRYSRLEAKKAEIEEGMKKFSQLNHGMMFG